MAKRSNSADSTAFGAIKQKCSDDEGLRSGLVQARFDVRVPSAAVDDELLGKKILLLQEDIEVLLKVVIDERIVEASPRKRYELLCSCGKKLLGFIVGSTEATDANE